MFKLVEPRPVKVSMTALPMPPRKVTELVPLPEQPPQVKIPDVVKVTGSAFAADVPSATMVKRNAPITVAFKIPDIFVPFCIASLKVPSLPGEVIPGYDTQLDC